jgi:hypothetical protein
MTASTGEKIATSKTKKPRRGFWKSVGDFFSSIGRGIRRAWHWTKAKAKQGWNWTKSRAKSNWAKFKVQTKTARTRVWSGVKTAAAWVNRNTRFILRTIGAAVVTAFNWVTNSKAISKTFVGIAFAAGWIWAFLTRPFTRKTTVTTTTTTEGDIIAREILPTISEVISNPDSTETEKAFYTEVSDSLDRQEAEVVASDFAHTDENFPGVMVLVEEDLALGELYNHEAVSFRIAGNKVIEAMMEFDGTYVDFDFAPFRGEHKDLMEALEWCLGASRTTDEASFWTGRLEALNAFVKDKGKLAQHGRWYALVNSRYLRNPEYKLKLIRTGFYRMVEDLQSTSQKATVGAGARR